jgi:hypothetical protein
MSNEWRKSCGWEYEILDLLPPRQKQRIWSRANREFMKTWRLTGLLILPVMLSVSVVWLLVEALGWGLLVRLAVELGLHGLLFHPYRHFVYTKIIYPAMRPLIQQELFFFIQQELSPSDSVDSATVSSVLTDS